MTSARWLSRSAASSSARSPNRPLAFSLAARASSIAWPRVSVKWYVAMFISSGERVIPASRALRPGSEPGSAGRAGWLRSSAQHLPEAALFVGLAVLGLFGLLGRGGGFGDRQSLRGVGLVHLS